MSVLEKISKGWVHPKVKATIDHNNKVKESRKRSMQNGIDALIDEKADEAINYERKGKRGFSLRRIKGWANQNKCYNGCGRQAKHRMFLAKLCDICYQQEQKKERVEC